MRRFLALSLTVSLVALPVIQTLAQGAPDRSLRPQLRGGSGTEAASAQTRARAASTVPLAETTTAAPEAAATNRAVGRSLRPVLRPGSGRQVAQTPAENSAPPQPQQRASSATKTVTVAAASSAARPAATGRDAAAAAASASTAQTAALKPNAKPRSRPKSGGLLSKRKLRKTSVCGDISIQGEVVGRVPGKVRGCGVSDAVRVKSVAGVTLSTPAVMNCQTAHALNTWVDKGLTPAFRRQGRVTQIKVAAHYICRTRNNRRGAKISEHGKGKAIDISAITLNDGRVYSVEESWWRGRGKGPMRQAYKAACGPFGTTLGPNADRYHQDHFHFDTANHRSGPYCR
ncbi:MAG: extensin family protein [Paracoccaceae bacterium]